MPGVSVNYQSSLSVDQTSNYHPSQQYFYQQSAPQHQSSQFNPYQSQLSLTNTSAASNENQSKSTPRSLPLPGEMRSEARQKKSDWNELEVRGKVRNLSPTLWTLSQLTVLYLNDNYLSRLPSEIACLTNLVSLDLSQNKLRNLPSEIGDLVKLRELNLTNNSIRNLPYEIGKLFRLQSLGLMGNPLPVEILSIYTESNGLQKLLTYFLDNLSSSINGHMNVSRASWLCIWSWHDGHDNNNASRTVSHHATTGLLTLLQSLGFFLPFFT